MGRSQTVPEIREWSSWEDGELMEVLATEGDSPDEVSMRKDACAELWRRYNQVMTSWAISELQRNPGSTIQALDIVQDVFAKMLHAAVSRKFSRDRQLKPWLYRVVMNQARGL